jgi:hypothetical protein
MDKKELNNAIIDVLNSMKDEIDSLPGLKHFHEDDPIYTEAIEIAKDKVFNAIEDIIIYVQTDDAEDAEEEEDKDL